MDAISYAHSAKQARRIKKFIQNPDSDSGIVTVPSTIEAGESVTVPAGRTAILPDVIVDGDLNIEGTVFIPTGTTYTQESIRTNNITSIDGVTSIDVTDLGVEAGTGISVNGNTVNFYPYNLTTATTELTSSDYVVVSDSTTPKKITLANLLAEFGNDSLFGNSKSINGYTKLPNGLILQWGRGNAGSSVVFPISFPTNVLKIIVTHRYNIGGINGAFVYVSSSSSTGFTRADQTYECEYLAIGY